MAGTARKAARDRTRRRIIDAAVDVFAERGFFGARVSAIAEAAAVAEGTLYVHFKSKDDILVAVFREKMAELLTQLSNLVALHDDPETKLMRYVAEHLELVANQPKLMHVMTIELRQSGSFMRQHGLHGPFARYLAKIAGVIEDGQRSGAFRTDVKPLAMTRLMFGALDQIALAWFLTPKPVPGRFERAAQATELGEFFLRGLRAER